MDPVIYTAGTSGTWTVPPGIVSFTVVCYGGGGGGVPHNGVNAGGGGGGGGACVVKTFSIPTEANIGDNFSFSVGTGGSPNQPGNQTTFAGGSTTMVAGGGGVGTNSSGGSGGIGSGGDSNNSGGNGLAPFGNNGGPGGSGAGRTENGNAPLPPPNLDGGDGVNSNDGILKGAGGNGGSFPQTGKDYGGGGAGGSNYTGTGPGRNGGNGVIIIEFSLTNLVCFHPSSQLLVNNQYKTVDSLTKGDQLVDDNGQTVTVKNIHYYRKSNQFYQVDSNVWVTKKHLVKQINNKTVKRAERMGLPLVNKMSDYTIHIETDGLGDKYFIPTSESSIYAVEVWGQSHPNIV